MKTLIFSGIVVVSAYYLLSQTDSGQALLDKVLPGQQIARSGEELLAKVDSRLQDFASTQSIQQTQKIQQLEQQISALTALLAQQQNAEDTLPPEPQPSVVESQATSQQTAGPTSQAAVNDALNLPPHLTHIQAQTASAPKAEQADVKELANKTLQRQKQAALQDIAARMEQVSLQVASGAY